MKHFILLLLTGTCAVATAQKSSDADSATVAQTLHSLATICQTLNFADPQVQQQGTFYKAAPYVVYRGQDSKRKWKTFCNYKKPADRAGVDNVCERINQTINQDTAWHILQYSTQKESEGKWHVLEVEYTRKGNRQHAIFAFLKIGNRFGIGDIDN